MLDAFPQIRTTEVEALESAVARAYGDITFDVKGSRERFRTVANHSQLSGIGLTYAKHGAEIEIGLRDTAFYAQLFSVNGSAQATVGREQIRISEHDTFLCSPSDKFALAYSGAFEQLVVKVNTAALVRQLEILTGSPKARELRFQSASDVRTPQGAFHRHLIFRLISMLESAPHMPSSAFLELEQSILTSFLVANAHNFSELLASSPRPSAPWQVRRAEEYMEAHWDQPLTMEQIADACQTSVRSLFHTFRKSRNHSPMEWLRMVRLRHAREMLIEGKHGTSVTDVALACGFSNVGHFARYYRQHFDERPSDTLAASR